MLRVGPMVGKRNSLTLLAGQGSDWASRYKASHAPMAELDS